LDLSFFSVPLIFHLFHLLFHLVSFCFSVPIFTFCQPFGDRSSLTRSCPLVISRWDRWCGGASCRFWSRSMAIYAYAPWNTWNTPKLGT
jgi:hypothetical protein